MSISYQDVGLVYPDLQVFQSLENTRFVLITTYQAFLLKTLFVFLFEKSFPTLFVTDFLYLDFFRNFFMHVL